ncbi:MAG: XRE family transcriptional regulator [Pseudomonadota bacterium]
MTDADDDILKTLPLRLKEARKSQRLSLEAVSKLSGVSRSMLSQIERGESSPTISTLWNLTRALKVDFAGLLNQREPGDSIDVLKASEAPTIDKVGQKCRIAILSSPDEAGGHEVYDIFLQKGGSLKSKPHPPGTTEQLTVLEGTVRVASGAAAEQLSTGDTARYAADVPHEILAVGAAARVFLLVKMR